MSFRAWGVTALMLGCLACADASRPPTYPVGLVDVFVPPLGDSADGGAVRDAAVDASIEGVWFIDHNGCREFHTFLPDGGYRVVGGLGERITGSYRLDPHPMERARLRVDIDADNGVADCKGMVHDETGELYVGYIALVQGGRRMDVYWEPTGNALRFSLFR